MTKQINETATWKGRETLNFIKEAHMHEFIVKL